MNDIYFPSCNLSIASPASSRKIRTYLKEKMTVAGCCLHDTQMYDSDQTGITVCQNCRTQLEPKIHTISLWEYLDQDTDFPFPDYHGLVVNVQDCYRDKDYPEVGQHMRSLLRKMHIQIVEIEHPEDFCGTLYYHTRNKQLAEEIAQYPDVKLSRLPEDLQVRLMKEHVCQFDQEIIVCDCNRCVKGIQMGGGKAVHLLDLLMNEFSIL